MRDYQIDSDLRKSKYTEIEFVQYDNGSVITINLIEEGKAVDLTNCTAIAKFKREDGKEFSRVATVEDNKLKVTLDSTVTAVVGTLKIIFKITYETDKQASTFAIYAKISENFGEGDSGNIGGNTEGSTEVTVDLSNYYKKSETYSKKEIDTQFEKIVYIYTHIYIFTHIKMRCKKASYLLHSYKKGCKSMALKRVNVTMQEELYDEFYKYACRKGISISPFLQAKMREFIEEEKEFEEFKKLKKEGKLKDLIDTE